MSVVRRIQDELETAGVEVSSENIATSGSSVNFSMDEIKSYRTFLQALEHSANQPKLLSHGLRGDVRRQSPS